MTKEKLTEKQKEALERVRRRAAGQEQAIIDKKVKDHKKLCWKTNQKR